MIASLTTSFLTLSHTFLRREVRALRARGVPLKLYGVRPEADPEIGAGERREFATQADLYPVRLLPLLAAHLRFALRAPQRYFPALGAAVFNEERAPRAHLKFLYHFLVSPALAERMRRDGVRHVHAHFLHVPATLAMHCARLLGIGFSITVHSAGTAGLRHTTGLRAKFRRARFLCTISEYNREHFGRAFDCLDKMHVVRCGLPRAEVTGRPAAAGAVEEPAADGRPCSVLAVGRFVEKKGFDQLLEAMVRLRGRPFHLTLIGDGPLRPSLEERMRAAGLERQVTMTGSLGPEAIRGRMEGADVVVVPSVTAASGEMEGIPVVILEAMAAGVPVIATAHSGIPELVRDGETGILVPERDPAAISEALECLARDKTLADRLQKQALALVLSKYTVETATERLEALLH